MLFRSKLSQSKFSRMSWLGLSGAVSCCTLVLVFGLMLFPSLSQTTYAAPEPGAGGVTPSTGTSVGISLPASIDFDSLTPTPDGATTTATADLTITTTNSASYSLYLYSSDGDNSLRPNNSANISKINATTGDVGLTLSSLEPNTWGYNLGTSAPDDNTVYSAVPTDNSTPIQTKDTSVTNSANDTYTLSFGAKVDTTITSGAYSNTLTFAVVAEPAMVTVAFNGNGATSGSMSSIKIPAGGSQALPSNTFIRNGYAFNGWNTASNGSGTSYADGANYAASTSYAGQTITLYAQWKEPVNIGYIQNFTSAQCQAQASAQPVVGVDIRDNNKYTLRYINGNCWMTQNLRIASGTVLTSTYSNVSSSYTIPTTPLEGSTPSDTEGQTQYSDDPTIGAWYNFCAASAGTMCDASWRLPDTAPYDICPRGWRLPTEAEWNSIFGDKSSSQVIAFSPVYGGWYSDGSIDSFYLNTYGRWWSSTVGFGADYNYFSSQLEEVMGIQDLGYYVRCIRSS